MAAPRAPAYVYPKDGAADVPLNTLLWWEPSLMRLPYNYTFTGVGATDANAIISTYPADAYAWNWDEDVYNDEINLVQTFHDSVKAVWWKVDALINASNRGGGAHEGKWEYETWHYCVDSGSTNPGRTLFLQYVDSNGDNQYVRWTDDSTKYLINWAAMLDVDINWLGDYWRRTLKPAFQGVWLEHFYYRYEGWMGTDTAGTNHIPSTDIVGYDETFNDRWHDNIRAFSERIDPSLERVIVTGNYRINGPGIQDDHGWDVGPGLGGVWDHGTQGAPPRPLGYRQHYDNANNDEGGDNLRPELLNEMLTRWWFNHWGTVLGIDPDDHGPDALYTVTELRTEWVTHGSWVSIETSGAPGDETVADGFITARDADKDTDGDWLNYDLYFDTVNPPLRKILDAQAFQWYDPSAGTFPSVGFTPGLNQEPLSGNTTYYWKITSRDAAGNTTDSNVFSFTTAVSAAAVDIPLARTKLASAREKLVTVLGLPIQSQAIAEANAAIADIDLALFYLEDRVPGDPPEEPPEEPPLPPPPPLEEPPENLPEGPHLMPSCLHLVGACKGTRFWDGWCVSGAGTATDGAGDGLMYRNAQAVLPLVPRWSLTVDASILLSRRHLEVSGGERICLAVANSGGIFVPQVRPPIPPDSEDPPLTADFVNSRSEVKLIDPTTQGFTLHLKQVTVDGMNETQIAMRENGAITPGEWVRVLLSINNDGFYWRGYVRYAATDPGGEPDSSTPLGEYHDFAFKLNENIASLDAFQWIWVGPFERARYPFKVHSLTVT